MNYILIVEDEEFLLRALKDNLEGEGYKIGIASDGDEAIKQIEEKKPDLILLDILMPKRDGFFVLEAIKSNPKWKLIPVIILSNLGDDDDIKKALGTGANDYFVKTQHPIEEVVEKVKEYLEGRGQNKRSR